MKEQTRRHMAEERDDEVRREEEPLASLLCGLGWVRPELHHPLACVQGWSVQLSVEGPYVSASILCAVKSTGYR